MGRERLGREESGGAQCPYEIWAMAAVTLLAFMLRVQQLDVAPPAFSYDEAARAVESLDLLQGQHALMAKHLPGVTTLFPYLTAGAFDLLGARAAAQRLLAVFASTLAVPLTYAFARMLFLRLGRRRAGVTGALAALGLAVSYWQVHFGRVGLETALVPPVMLLCLIALWRGLAERRVWHLASSGALFGLGLWVEPAFAFAIPLAAALICLTPARAKNLGFVNADCGFAGPQSTIRNPQSALLALGVFVVGLAVVCAPLGAYFAGHPDELLRWGTETLFLRPAIHGGDPLGTLLRSAVGNVLAFGFTGDPSPAANLPGRPLLDPAMALLFWGGLALSVARFRQRPYGFCVLWWAVMCLPAVLMPERIPHFGRLMAAAPVICVFPALAIDALVQGARRFAAGEGRWRRFAPVALAVALICAFGWTAISTHFDYFRAWAGSEGAYRAFNGPDRELAARIDADGPDTVYVLPYDVLWTPAPHAVLRFFHSGQGADAVTIHVNELDVPRQLDAATAGRRTAKWVRMAQGKTEFLDANADPKALLGFYLEQHGALVETSPYAGGEIWTYRLPDAPASFGRLLQFLGHGAAFDRQLWLESSAMGNASYPGFDEDGEVAAGDTLWLVTQWELLNPNADDYLARLRLVDAAGNVAAEAERRLLDDVHRPSSLWVKRDIPVLDFCLFPVPGDLPAGEYTLEAGVYAPKREDLLPIQGTAGEQFFPMRTVEVGAFRNSDLGFGN